MAADPLAGYRVLGFDLETTGFSNKKHRIVQYALIGCDADGSSMHLEGLVNPQMRIPMETTQIHGIHDSDVKNAPQFSEYITEISAAMEGAVIVGHNVERFDWPFLRSEFLRAGQPMPTPLAILDTLKIARKLKIPPKHNLAALCERFGISLERAHTAGADAAATLLLLHKMMAENPQHFRRAVEDIPEWSSGSNRRDKTTESLGPDIEDLEPVFGSHGWLKITQTGMVIGRGRNRGRTIAEIERKDANYLNWLGSSAGPLEAEAVSALQAERND
ncbi:MAG: 3'-5' exonuclease [Candidatus Poseidoniales archaeon]|nr:3'-5' exonuclease [Candidatus Poseidoniales archaeon]